jgi:metal-responsive CopG/Arc/MetJ family transcriptional regulator
MNGAMLILASRADIESADSAAKRLGLTRSEFVRRAVRRAVKDSARKR